MGSAAIGLSFETPLSSAAEDDELSMVRRALLLSAEQTATPV
jgi:hypothetical protein